MAYSPIAGDPLLAFITPHHVEVWVGLWGVWHPNVTKSCTTRISNSSHETSFRGAMSSFSWGLGPAASIWFEICGGRGSGSKNFDFLGTFPKNFDFFQAISQTKNRLFRANFKKFRFFSCNFTKDSDVQGTFLKNFAFLR